MINLQKTYLKLHTENETAFNYLVVKAQEKYCTDNHCLMFMPNDNICYRCGFQAVTDIEKASHELITGCQACHHTFVD